MIEIVPLQHGQVTQTRTLRELADAINEAKKIVDANRKIANWTTQPYEGQADGLTVVYARAAPPGGTSIKFDPALTAACLRRGSIFQKGEQERGKRRAVCVVHPPTSSAKPG
jgi:hypothetical protein